MKVHVYSLPGKMFRSRRPRTGTAGLWGPQSPGFFLCHSLLYVAPIPDITVWPKAASAFTLAFLAARQ